MHPHQTISILVPAALAATLAAAAAAAPAGRLPGPGVSPAAAATPVDDSWLARVQQDIRRGEYQLSPAADGEGLSAPNRAHGLRTTWRLGRLEVRPRVEASAWSFEYELIGVGRAGAEAAAAPVASEWLEAGRLEWARSGLREWYVNDERGVEQGFVLETRPGGDEGEPVAIDGAIEGLLAYPAEDGASVLLRTPEGKDALRIRDLRVTDAGGRELAACFAVGDGMLRIAVDDRDAVYPVTVDPLLTSPGWTAESDQVFALFGVSVATAGDVNGDGYDDVIVGAYLYDNGQTDEGRAFVYSGSASGLAATASWTAEGNQPSAFFGTSVASAGDVNGDGYGDVIVGASGYSNGEAGEGGAFVYHGSPSGLASTAAWLADGNQVSGNFGGSVASAGDVNGDGFSDVVVGARQYDNGQTNEGRAFAYLGSAAGLSTSPDWTAESDQADASFGGSVAAAGDVNGDGYGDVVVGAPSYDNPENGEGAAFVYHGSASGLSTTVAWTAESNQAFSNFGSSVASSGDVNGDGYGDVIVGASSYDNPENGEGAAFVYHGSASGLSTTAAWTAESNQAFSGFGFSVASAGDVNGDGYGDVIVGAPSYDNGEDDEGRAFVYQGSAAGLASTAAWMVESNQVAAQFGTSVASAGDVNGDGYSDVVVGALAYSNGQTAEGGAFVYHGSAAGLAASAGFTAEGDSASAQLGYSVAAAGDVNGDGYSDIVVGAYEYDDGQANEGRALIYAGTADGPNTSPLWSVEGNQANANLGWSVAGAGDVDGDGYSDVIVGALGFDNPEVDEGRAFLYLGSESMAMSPAWSAESNQAGAQFGFSVAGAGDVNGDGFSDVVVGARNFDNGETDEGRAFVYHGSSAGLGASAAATREGNQAGARFGSSVATAGDVNRDGFSDVVIGAPEYDNGQVDEGRAFVYHGATAGIGASPARTLEPNQAGAHFGTSVATAGDVNGDGYSDVAVGAPEHDNGQADEGRAYVFHGSPSGIGTIAAWRAESNQAGAAFGRAVASGGDVNGDGYGDLLVGAPAYSNGQTSEGRAYAYLGSASGLGLSPAWTAESDQPSAFFGQSLAAAGDVNGDGFGDVVVGAYLYSNDQAYEGRMFLYYGNGGDGLDRTHLALRRSSFTPIDLFGLNGGYSFRAYARGRTPFGRGKVRLEVEVKPLATPFDGTGLLLSSWQDTGAPVAGQGSMKPILFDLPPIQPTGMVRWRARLRTRSPLPWTGPWMSTPRNAMTEGDLRIPPADLQVTALVVPATCGAGRTISVTPTVKNAGPGTAAPTTVKYWMSLDTVLDPSEDVDLGNRSVPDLAPGASVTPTHAVTVPADWPAGTANVIAQADATGVVKETNETNNTRAKSTKVGPDLQVTALTAPASAGRGTTIAITDTTKDIGGGDAAASVTGLYLSSDGVLDEGDLRLGARMVPALVPGAASTGPTSVVIPTDVAPGAYTLIAVADDAQVILETNETNNTKTKPITIN